MAAPINQNVDPLARTVNIGDAPVTQTGTGGQWVNAWSKAGVTALHKANVTNAGEAWIAVKYIDLLSSALVGGDIYGGDLGVSGQSAATSTIKQEIDGKEGLRFKLAESASTVSINLSSFFANDDGTSFAEGARVRLYDAAGNLVGESFAHATNTAGNQFVQISSSVAFRSVEISAGAPNADGSFSFGGYTNSDGTFGSDVFADAGTIKHGSDFLIDKVTFEIARPVSAGESYSLDEDAGLQSFVSVLTNDKDPDGAALSASLVAGPSHGTLSLNADGTFSYQANANYFGADAYTYRAFNGRDYSNETLVQLTIRPVNDAPVAANDTAATNEDTAISGNVLTGANGGQDTDVDGDTLTLSTIGTFTTTLGAAVTLSADGTFAYNPTGSATLQALAAGASLIDGFDYTVSDGHGGTALGHVAVTVNGRAELPPTPSAVILPSVAPGTQLSYYLRYTDAGGASKWLQVNSFEVGAQATSSWSSGGGGSVGQPHAGEFRTVLGSSAAANDFMEKILQGGVFSRVELEAYASGPKGDPVLVQEIKLGGVFVTGVQTGGNAASTSNALSLVYKTFGEAVSPLDGHGTPIPAKTVGWDIQAGTTNGDLPDPGPDAQLNDLGSQLPVNAQLDYYVHIDGITGWYALSGFGLGYGADSSWTKGGGPSVGKPIPYELQLRMGSSQALTTLLQDIITGHQRASIQVEAYYNSGGKNGPQLVDEYFFNSAFTVGVDNAAGGENAFSLAYRSFTHSHLAYSNGVMDSANSNKVGYDVATDSAVNAPAPSADAVRNGVATVLPSVEPGTHLSYYLRYSDAGGVSKWLEVNSFDVGVTSTTSWTLGGGAAVGKPNPGEFTTVLGSSAAANDFMAKILQGSQFASVELEAYTTGLNGEPAMVQEFRLGGVFVTSLRTEGSAGTTSNALSFVYKTFGEAVAPLDSQERPTLPKTVGWDIPAGTTNGPLPDPGPDARPGELGSQLPVDAQLNYYVHIDGISGWFALSAFAMGYEADTSWTSGSGATIGRPMPTEVALTMGSSQAITSLLQDVITGHQKASIQVEAYTTGDAKTGPQLVDEYFFNSAFTTRVDNSAAGTNSLSLVYKSFSHSHLAYTDIGDVDAANSNSVAYDIGLDKVTSGPKPVAEAVSHGVATVLPSVEPGAQLSYYLRYSDSDGASKWLQVDYFDVGVTAATNWTAGGAAVGKAIPGEFTTVLGSSAAASDFMEKILKGAAFTSVELEAYASGVKGEPVLVQEFKLGGVFVTSVQTAGYSLGTSNSLSLVYKTLGEAVSPFDSHGAPTPPKTIGWDIPSGTTNGDLPDPGPDAQLNDLGSQLPVDVQLDYYVHIDGINGWFALGDFTMGFGAASSWTKLDGASIGKPVPADLTLKMGSSQGVTELLTDLITGRQNASIQIEAYLSGGDRGPQLVDEYFFNSALVTSVDSADAGVNSLSLAYKTFTHSHLAYKDGAVDSANSSGLGYDLATAKVIGVPPPVADVFH